jgi:hypothetical protein
VRAEITGEARISREAEIAAAERHLSELARSAGQPVQLSEGLQRKLAVMREEQQAQPPPQQAA